MFKFIIYYNSSTNINVGFSFVFSCKITTIYNFSKIYANLALAYF